jgi:beta-glucosidase
VYGDDAKSVDLATGVRAAVSNAASIIVAEGSGINEPIAGGIAQAVAAARNADVVVLAIGEPQNMSGEAQSRTEIVVPEAQQQLAEAVAAVGKPMVVVLKNGRALALEGAVAAAPAILVTWFLGSQTGHAIADILFGTHSPSGRLPISFPRASGQQPYHYAHKRTGRPNPPGGKREEYKAQFREVPNSALYPFGHGLTYGRIEYSDFALSAPTMSMNGEITVSARVTNRGRRSAQEVVQLYIHDRTASITRPVQLLKAFRKVPLAPGEYERVTFRIRPSDLAFIGVNNRPVIEPGMFDVWIAPSAEVDGVRGAFELKA